MFRNLVAAGTLGLVCIGCTAGRLRSATLRPIFGPVVSADTISGRADDGKGMIWLMVGGASLVRIDPTARAGLEVALQLPGREPCWGLARLSDGSMWTLMGRNVVIEISPEGRVGRQIALPQPHLGLFAKGDRLIFQRASLPPNTPALFAGHPDDAQPSAWSAMTTRPFEALAPGAAAALNLVACGITERDEMPCWFPGEPAVSLISPDGRTRRLELAGLPYPAPETLINARSPQRPIRDVFVERDGTMWVISTGTAPERDRKLPGGWLLARFGPRGEAIDRRILPEPARIILSAAKGRAIVLTGSGMVAEVLP